MDNTSGVCQHLRPASEPDLDKVMEIERASFVDQWDYPQFKAALKDIFLVYDEEQIAGFIIACYCQLAKRGIILRIAVEPSQRGKGIAKALIMEALTKLKDYDTVEVELSVDIVKTGAIKLYEKFGFRVMQVVSMNYDNANESFYIMKLNLTK
jgi:[ribosomal protein S18]-alanine N-acetyltransferase